MIILVQVLKKVFAFESPRKYFSFEKTTTTATNFQIPHPQNVITIARFSFVLVFKEVFFSLSELKYKIKHKIYKLFVLERNASYIFFVIKYLYLKSSFLIATTKDIFFLSFIYLENVILFDTTI